MRSAIILALVAILRLEVQTSATKISQFYPVERTDQLDFFQLFKEISVEIPGTQVIEYPPPTAWYETRLAPKVVEFLAKAQSKDVIHSTLMSSIDDLLKLNEWTLDDCKGAELKNRRDKCGQYFKEGYYEDLDRISCKTPLEFVHFNIGSYCWKVVHELESRCRLKWQKQTLKALNRSMGLGRRLELFSFESRVNGYISKHNVPFVEKVHTIDSIKSDYQKVVEQSFAIYIDNSRLKRICKDLVEKLKKFYDAKILPGKWTKKFIDCSIINGIQA